LAAVGHFLPVFIFFSSAAIGHKLLAQRKGKGRAANESLEKLANLIQKQTFKTAIGRRVPLTALLGQS